MKKNKKEKLAKASFTLSMVDLKNLEVISDEILYSLDYNSLNKYVNEIPELDDHIEKDTEEHLKNFKPDFNGLRLDKNRTASNDNFYEDIFSKKDTCDKNILLDTIYDVGDEREIPILKQIIVHEENLGLKEKALKILNGITEQNYWYSEEERAVLEIETIRDRCIFKPLFKSADLETKLVLLEQIEEIGGAKELTFLKTLEGISDIRLKKKINSTVGLLEERVFFNAPDTPKPVIVNSSYKNSSNKSINSSGFSFLLDDLNIRPSNESDEEMVTDTQKNSKEKMNVGIGLEKRNKKELRNMFNIAQGYNILKLKVKVHFNKWLHDRD